MFIVTEYAALINILLANVYAILWEAMHLHYIFLRWTDERTIMFYW